MEKSSFSYKTIEGIPTKEIQKQLLEVYQKIFEDAKPEFFIDRIESKQDLVCVLCYSSTKLIGFKIGYQYKSTTFYSWVGGVQSNYRKQGIGKQLAILQEQLIIQKGYTKLRTKSMNRFKPMMILNLKNGFNIVQVYTNSLGQTKVVFEKDLL